MANERHVDHREWEIDASTRTSGHPFTKYIPFRTATSTTASTLVSVPTQVLSTNWVENPGVEGTDVGMFTAVGSAIARDTGQAAEGAASLIVNPANSAANLASPPALIRLSRKLCCFSVYSFFFFWVGTY